MRALGYYPTEREVDDLVNEIQFSKFVDTGEYVDNFSVEDLIKCIFIILLLIILIIY
jgi:hypothetical protein